MKHKPGPKPKPKPYAEGYVNDADNIERMEQAIITIVVDYGNGATMDHIRKAARKALMQLNDFMK